MDVTNDGIKAINADGTYTVLTRIEGTGSDPFSVKSGVYLYQNTTGSKLDIIVPFAGGAEVQSVAVTDITKGLDRLGYATESRDRAIDHTYEWKLTNNNIKACIVTAADDEGNPYNYNGYPMVKTLSEESDVVPANTGVVLQKVNHPTGSSTLPLFVPAVNLVPAADAKSTDFWKSNLMIPNVVATRHYSEETTLNLNPSVTETSIITLTDKMSGYGEDGPTWNVDELETTIFGFWDTKPNRYVDLSDYTELRIYQTAGEPVRCFFYPQVGTTITSETEGVEITPASSPALEWVNGVNGYYSLDLTKIQNALGHKKLIAIKASAYNTTAMVSDVKVSSSVVIPEGTKCTKFVMGPSYFVYDKVTETSSSVQEVDREAFYRMRLDPDPLTAATNNTLAANKALLAIPTSSLPLALWNGGNGEGSANLARNGIIYIDLHDIDENEVTGVGLPIAAGTSEDTDTKRVFYTLSGIKINGKPTVKGIYICNGKKVSVK